jgi:hypothetical protein
VRRVTSALVPSLIALNALQSGQAIPGGRDWPRRVTDAVLDGADGYCLLDPLRTYSSETAALLAALQAVVARHRDDRYETADLVHFDFNRTAQAIMIPRHSTGCVAKRRFLGRCA